MKALSPATREKMKMAAMRKKREEALCRGDMNHFLGMA